MNYFIFLCFLYLLSISFKRNRSIFTPSNFFILVWFSNYFILMFFVHDFYLHYAGSAVILLMCSVSFIASNMGMEYKNKKRKKEKKRKGSNLETIIKELKPVAIILSCLGFCVVPMMIISIKGDFLSIFSFKYIQHLSRYVSILRYKDEYTFPLSVQMFLGLNYFAALLNGVYFGYLYLNKQSKHFYLYLIAIMTSILIAIITTEKAVIIFTTLLFASSFIVTYNSLSQKEFKISLRNSLLFIGSFITMLLLFVYIQMNRYGFSDANGFQQVVRKFKIYAFGHISAFSCWFNDYLTNFGPLGYGRFTFAGIFSYFHIYERKPGIFTDFAVISHTPDFTNVYTAYRGLIVDFSLFGASIIIFIFSFLAGMAYNDSKESLLAFIYLILFYCITVISIFTSLLNYNTLIAAFVLLSLTLFYYDRYKEKMSDIQWLN